jgi:hypothetical protein
MAVMAVSKFERFFRQAAGLDVDKRDVDRHSDFVFDKIHDLLLRAQATAKANGRDVVDPWDLPITKGLQENIHRFEKLDEEVALEPILDRLAGRPQMDMARSEETDARIGQVAGGLSVALARTFTILEPGLKNPQSTHWDRAFQIFDLLL